MKTIELLAPAKDYDCARAAVDCGADALYIGAPRFGARVDAAVPAEQIAAAADYAHRYGVRLFVALNTLIYEEELHEAQQTAREVCAAGADALIVQDLAFLRMDLPPIELHASTQMFTFDPLQAQFLSRVGFTRIVLERASTLTEIRAMAEAVPQTEIEAFVHGALCVGYSGRCYLSRSFGNRSGNRGACMQACRLPYDLYTESGRRLSTGRHLLSLQDLNLTDHLGAMIDAGVTSFKIEGRLKDRHYVQNIVGWYRQRLDEALARRPDFERASEGSCALGFEPNPRKGFARGATHYYIDGLHTGVASFDTPKSLGEPIGPIRRVDRETIEGECFDTLSAGDGICFKANGQLFGTGVNRREGTTVWPNSMEGLRPSIELYRNFDRRFTATLDSARTRRTLGVQATLTTSANRITLQVADAHHRITRTVEGSFAQARDAVRTCDTMRTQLSKTGGTIFRMDQIHINPQGVFFVPAATLNALRREALEDLEKARLASYRQRPRLSEDPSAIAPERTLTAEANVANSLAATFWRDHGVETIVPARDLQESLVGCRVLRTRYCLRREMGQCLKQGAPAERWYIATGPNRYELEFDCHRCEMSVTLCSPTPENHK